MARHSDIARPSDIAIVSLATTPGLRHADEVLASLVREAGASCRIVPVRIGLSGKLRRHIAVTDLVESLAARRAGRTVNARAVVMSTATTALLHRPSAPFAVRFDSPVALNRPGMGGAWQRTLERRMLPHARLLLPWGRAAAEALPPLRQVGQGPGPRVVALPVPVEEVAGAAHRDIDALAYAGYPRKRGLDLLCAAWAEAAPSGSRLVIGGADRAKGVGWLERCGVPEPAGVEWAGALPRDRWLELLGRARVFLNASRREDHGLSQLEALSAGTPLVTVPSPGPYEALPLARALAPELVAANLSPYALTGAIRAGLALDKRAREAYADRARDLLAPYRREAAVRVVAAEVLPGLGIDVA